MLKAHVLSLQNMVSLDLLCKLGGRVLLPRWDETPSARLRENMLRAAIRGASLGLLYTAVVAVCSAQAIPFFTPSNSTASVKELQGRVSVMRDGYPWVLEIGSTVKSQQMITTGPDGYAKFQVSDGSTFEVFQDSKVVFRANPGDLRDLVDMVIGRIRVHIEKLGGQPNPNNVKTPSAVISVRGTIFDVTVDQDDTTVVAVTEGLVAVRHAIQPGNTERLVPGGAAITVYKNEPLAKRNVDKGLLAQRVFRGLADAAMEVLMRGPRGGGGSGPVAGGTGTGDTKAEPPPPPPPPPAAPPAPPNN
jgi:hypothetical protein